ncbi:ArsR/SmtB family transcription factor [Levilactobacillus acidifarinae]|uniref:HTH arsR-type domain-containing protein n=1 Tax=Levilactobacillus acidifarinae DSM 19394 = JCM 15949 TaxID=1423715 RepID=A0A0R1LQD9_9LACO|nr:metalloregulator ArsR/SmtB family transcription factor [Levilactobacillus acidifarinae]KRK95843.1 hypothetical protein FD25_GL002299 [Levilactobacillus acidifarinae DSM 19394]GEO69141.1 transcriptional regulator [Levilactobacillus acidifarinae]
MTPRERTTAAFQATTPLFSVLADTYRQQLLLELGAHPEGRNVTDLTTKMTLSRPAVSHHLQLLKQAGLVTVKRQGTQNFYVLTLDESITQIRALLDLLETNCLKGDH